MPLPHSVYISSSLFLSFPQLHRSTLAVVAEVALACSTLFPALSRLLACSPSACTEKRRCLIPLHPLRISVDPGLALLYVTCCNEGFSGYSEPS
ncbi:hypothetical protein GUJ93_ZPchr0001g31498 [Zizania palustris]|uniref:Uncharacterized protein n=1 Tax=Zizania palustris TaxID=103762 RepID=A0A8J5VAR5_ZIZPA|nr:hypothetical protein GUJ93_ZPchr0001g31498 [Zizania palustris]